MTDQQTSRTKRRFKMAHVAENSRSTGITVAANPLAQAEQRDPIFRELDEAIEREAEQARRRVARAAGKQ